jgi:hypothetical protein
MPRLEKRALPLLCALVFSLELWPSASQAQAAPQLLPLKRVRLYEVGVGYFERSGVLRDGSDLGLSLPASQLDDALSSLVILGGAGQARVSAIEFDSRESSQLARAEADLAVEPGAPLEFADVLRSFRGASVEVRAHGPLFRGRLVDVISLAHASAEHCSAAEAPADTSATSSAAAPCHSTRDASLVLLDEHGTLSRLALTRVESVRALDKAVAARLSRALDAVSGSSHARTRQILRVHGSGSAALRLGYVAEAPVWRASYRLVLDKAERTGTIQGFALIHNDSDETWRGVKLELANGRPTSFLYPLAAPRYARRPLTTPDEPLSTVPQLLKESADEGWDQTVTFDDAFGAGGLGLQGAGEGGGGRGEGIGLGAVGTLGHGSGTSDLLAVGQLSALTGASGVEGAAQFVYTLGPAIDLGAHASALVPFVDESLTVTRVTWFGDANEAGETGVRLVNSSARTLPAGLLTVFSEAGFSGSSQLPRMKPGEARVVRFGQDLDVTLQRTQGNVTREPRSYSFEDGELREHSLRRSKLRFDLSNKSVADRTLSATLDIVQNARIDGADEASYDRSLSRAVVSFRVPAGASATRELTITEGIVTPLPQATLSSTRLERAAALGAIPKAQRALLKRAANALYQAEVRRSALPKSKADLDDALADVARFESHVRALGASSDEGQLAAERLRRTEDRLAQLRQRVHSLHSQISELEARARTTLAQLGHGTPLQIERSLESTTSSSGDGTQH